MEHEGTRCVCGSGLAYAACCGPYHRGGEAPSPEALMRSRYAAFALGEHEYLYRTLHPDHDDRAVTRAEALARLAEGARACRYQRLVILDTRGPDADGASRVLFSVTMRHRGRDASFVELSRFVHDGEGYRYLCGDLLPRAACPRRLEAFDIAAFEALFAARGGG